GVGTVVALAAAGVNFAVARILLRAARESGSVVLEADGRHLMADVWTSVAVVVGLGLVAVTGVRELDALLALGVGLHILGTGFGLARRAVNGLMDHALKPAEQERLRQVIRAAVPPGADFHHLRTRQAGRRKFADFHLLVDGGMTVRAAHAIAHAVEAEVRAVFPELELVIHIEPIDEPESWETAELTALGEPAEPCVPRRPDEPIAG
ncbi:MAG: cation diffusion facilitator family transporter, partial [Fimbriiglobus sp.]